MATIVSTRILRLQSISPRYTTVSPGLGVAIDYSILLNKPTLGALASQNSVNLATQITGQLAAGNINGLGALALLNAVNLTTQVSGSLAVGNVSGLGALATKNTASATTDITGLGTLATLSTVNAQTQVTNLGNLAFANQIAANQLGAGQLAAGVVYAGDLYANQVVSGTFSGVSIAIASAAGGWLLNAGHNGTVVAYRRLNGYNIYAGWFDSPGEPAVMGSGYDNVGVHGYSVAGATTNSHGLRGSRATGQSGIVGCANGYDFYAEGSGSNYGPFTGSHDCLLPIDCEYELGDIVTDAKCVARKGLSNTLFEVRPSTLKNQSAVVGVLAHINGPLVNQYVPSVFNNPVITTDDYGNAISLNDTEYEIAKNDYILASMNSLGEGQLNVCGEGGNIAAGDLIVASSLRGKGMRQEDNVLRSYTVAKAREAVNFEDNEQVKQIACIYLCG